MVNETTEAKTGQGKTNWVNNLLNGNFLKSKVVATRVLPIALLLVVYMLLVITNRYTVEQLCRDKIEAQSRINYLRETRIELQKHYQEAIKISQIAELLEDSDVGITAGPPYEI